MNFLLSFVNTTWYAPWESDFVLWLQSLGQEGSFAYLFFQFWTLFGEEYIMIALLGTLYWGIDKNRAEKIGFTLLTANVLNPMTKNIFARERPFNCPETSIKNFKDVGGYSFPSGHSSGAASIYGATAWYYRDKKQAWLTALAICVPLLVALSRNYLGAHWPTDVIVGLLLGWLSIFLVYFLIKLVKNKFIVYFALCALCASGFFYCKTDDFYTSFGMIVGFAFGVLFENKVVKFENTTVWWRIVLRLLGGLGIYLALNSLLKLIFGGIIDLTTLSPAEFAFRAARYAVILFVVIGVYPMIFKQFDKLYAKIKAKREQSAAKSDE